MRRGIIGAGIGGLSLAEALLNRGVESSGVTIIDAGSAQRGSSTPVAMVHPFQGRSMGLKRGQGGAFLRSWSILSAWAKRLGGSWWHPQAMIRPLSQDDRGQIMEESWREWRDVYPAPIRVEYFEAGELERRFEGVRFEAPGLVYGPAAAVDLPGLLKALGDDLEWRGVERVEAQMVGLSREERRWRVELSTGEERVFDEVILAMGAGLEQFFPRLDMRRRAGEVVVLDAGVARLPVMVSAAKHLIELPDGRWGLGSTYYSASQEPARDDEAVIGELIEGVVDMVPAVAEAELVGLWRGERSVYGADYLPLVGAIPQEPGLFCFGAFGSKGLLWAPSVAEDLAAELELGTRALSPFVDLRRIRAQKLVVAPALKGS